MNETSPLSELDTITEQEREAMLQAWREGWEAKKHNLLDYDQAVQILDKRSRPDAKPEDLEGIIPGSFTFGDDVKFFYTILEHITGKEAALKTIEHEIEHAGVYKRYKIPIDFAIVVSKRDTENVAMPLIISHFPEDMPEGKRESIMRESLAAVQNPSQGDIRAMRADV